MTISPEKQYRSILEDLENVGDLSNLIVNLQSNIMFNFHLLIKAYAVAAQAHKTQRRKSDSHTPYVNHLCNVALSLVQLGKIQDVYIIIAGILHDTLEDTDIGEDVIKSTFGKRILSYIKEVTDDKSLEKAERKRLTIEHAKDLSYGAACIKLADLIDNIHSVKNDPPAGWSEERRHEYIKWALIVVENLKPIIESQQKDSKLLECFYDMARS